MERPKAQDGIEDATYEALGVELDDADVEDLFYDCHEFIQRLLQRSNPQWLQNDGLKLVKRLEETLNWYRIH